MALGARLKQVHHDHQQQDREEHQREQRVDLRLDGLFGVVVDLDRKRDEARTGDEIGDDEVIEAHRKGHQCAGDDAGHDLVDDDLRECLRRRAAEIQRGLDQILVHLLELRHDVQNDIGEIERDVRDEQRPEAKDRVDAQHRAREREQKRQRDARDNVGVCHGDVRQRHDGAAELPVHAVDADGCHRAEDRRRERREHGDDQRVQQQTEKRAVTEKICILRKRKALERGDVGTGVEGRDAEHDHGDIQEDKDQNGHGAVKVLHTFAMTSSPSFSPKRFMMLTHRKIRIISTRLMAAPRFGL